MSYIKIMTKDQEKSKQKEEIEDPVELMLTKTGCIELHYKVQECIAETQDWRKCQEQVQNFKVCMVEYQKKQQQARS